MDNTIAEAIRLMLTGMSTVFLILVLVVLLGKVIIAITNNYSVSPTDKPKKGEGRSSEIETKKLAAIISAVETATQGQGSITSIRKLN